MSRLLGADTTEIDADFRLLTWMTWYELTRFLNVSYLTDWVLANFKLDLMRIDTNEFDSVTRSLMQKLAIYQMKQYVQCYQTFTSKFMNFLILRKAMHFSKTYFFSSRYQTGQCGTLLDTDLYRISGLVLIHIWFNEKCQIHGTSCQLPFDKKVERFGGIDDKHFKAI